ncbi:MAG: hypothetical protein GC204_16345 [Chloroflexi bacterium]|nr:hypothetical protein [Chloroflexota bacterium]
MSIRVEWDNPEYTCLLLDFYEPYSWVEFHESIQDIHQRIAAVSQTVDIIVWMKVGLPEGATLTHVRTAFKTHPANTGQMIIVSQQSAAMTFLSKRMTAIVKTLFPDKGNFVFADTIASARAIVAGTKTY